MIVNVDRPYNSFDSVDEVRRYFGINDSQINESQDSKESVVYADCKQEPSNIFKHIVIFTNSRNDKENKTLHVLYDAVRNIKRAKCDIVPTIHAFIAKDLTYETDDDNNLTITDGEEKFEFTDVNNTNTLIFSRLGVQGRDNCEHVVSVLQDRGFLVLNPIRYSELASNKYETATLLSKGNIPQPRYCLMTKGILTDEEQYITSMQSVYPDWSEDSDENKDKDVVCKILDGHGGVGVLTTDGKKLKAILQTIFAIDPERQLLIQKKEEGDGDIRVHVLNLRNRQIILAAMKRVRISGDFRSNVSLGAKAEKVKLTSEQERIALDTAKLSGLPWCAVDIMPLKKGSNKEIGDNVVLEINASPGTDGISEVIGCNFINILINELNDPREFQLQPKVAGFMESTSIDLGEGNIDMTVKLDTGNGSKASHVEVGKLDIIKEENKEYADFTLLGVHYKLPIVGYSHPTTGTQKHNRPIVLLKSIRLGLRCLNDTPMALVESRGDKSSNMLLNRTLMTQLGYIVDPSRKYILTKEIEKLNII